LRFTVFCPEIGGRKFNQNIGQILPDWTT